MSCYDLGRINCEEETFKFFNVDSYENFNNIVNNKWHFDGTGTKQYIVKEI